MSDQLYADDLPYWQTGKKSSPDDWMDKARAILERLGGKVLAQATARDANDRQVYMMAWRIGGDMFRLEWPVLPSKRGNMGAARIQAVTMVYHYVKEAAINAAIMGTRAAFLAHLVLPDGRTAGNADDTLLLEVATVTRGPLLLGRGT
jgi:hypothetical protein